MLSHHLLLTYRTFLRFKGSFLINLIGFSTGLAAVLLIYLWVRDEMSFDKFHAHDAQLYQVMERRTFPDRVDLSDESSGMLAEALAQEMPQVAYAAAVAPTAWFQKFTLAVGDKSLKATGQYVGKDYFQIFTFPLLKGDKRNVLADKNAIVLSESLALRLFHTTDNILGKAVRFQQERDFFVSGVLKDIPAHSSEQFDFVLSFELYKDMQSWVTQWKKENTGPHNYVLLKEDTDAEAFNASIAGIIARHSGDAYRQAFVLPFSDTYLYNTFDHGVRQGGRIEQVRLFSLIALFILAIACINFMNLATAKASRRVKEVGVKKALGVARRQLIVQFLSEALLLTACGVVTALLLVSLLLPEFNQLTGKQIVLSSDPALWMGVLAITLFTGLLAGSYPALYLSSFAPLAVLKGLRQTSAGEVWARKGLVIFQLTLSVVLMVGVGVVFKQMEYVQRKNLGYTKDNVLRFDAEGKTLGNPELLLEELKKIPGVVNASGTWHNIIGRNFATAELSWPGKNSRDIVFFEGAGVGYDFIEMLEMRVIAGRSFSRAYGEEGGKIILNEAAVAVMGLKEPVGKVLKLFGNDRQVIGVIKDFHYESLHKEVQPMYIALDPGAGNSWYKILVKIQAGKERETVARLQAFYAKFNPGFTLDFYFLDEAYQQQYVAEGRIAVLSRYFAGLAILISCLGLLGLAAFTAERRRKEIGIRKVLGAGNAGIVFLLAGDFTKLVLGAILIGLPLSYLVATQWLDNFVYHIPLKLAYFLLAGLLALLVTLFTVGIQAVRAARINPVRCLKED
jgi:predicted permease